MTLKELREKVKELPNCVGLAWNPDDQAENQQLRAVNHTALMKKGDMAAEVWQFVIMETKAGGAPHAYIVLNAAQGVAIAQELERNRLIVTV